MNKISMSTITSSQHGTRHLSKDRKTREKKKISIGKGKIRFYLQITWVSA